VDRRSQSHPDGQLLVVTERLTNSIDTFRHFLRWHASVRSTRSPSPGAWASSPPGLIHREQADPLSDWSRKMRPMLRPFSSFSVQSSGALIAVTQRSSHVWQRKLLGTQVTPGRQVRLCFSKRRILHDLCRSPSRRPESSSRWVRRFVATQPEGHDESRHYRQRATAKYVYTLNSMVGSISVFAINADGTLTPAGRKFLAFPRMLAFNGIAAPLIFILPPSITKSL